MGKEFVELKITENFNDRKKRLHYCILEYGHYYVRTEEFETISTDNKKLRKSVIADAITYINNKYGNYSTVHYYQLDVYGSIGEGKFIRNFDSRWLVSTLFNDLSHYIFDKNLLAKFITLENVGNERNYDITEGANAIVDFLNYIVKVNNFDRTFTIIDLYNKYLKQQHKMELNELQRFLELSGEYTQRLQAGETIDDTLDEVLNDIKRKDDLLEFKDASVEAMEELLFLKERDLDEELDALTYAYAKLDDENRVETDNEIIKDKIKAMSIR